MPNANSVFAGLVVDQTVSWSVKCLPSNAVCVGLDGCLLPAPSPGKNQPNMYASDVWYCVAMKFAPGLVVEHVLFCFACYLNCLLLFLAGIPFPSP